MPIYEAEVGLKSSMHLTINRDGKNLADFIRKLFNEYTTPRGANLVSKVVIKCPNRPGAGSVLGGQKINN